MLFFTLCLLGTVVFVPSFAIEKNNVSFEKGICQ